MRYLQPSFLLLDAVSLSSSSFHGPDLLPAVCVEVIQQICFCSSLLLISRRLAEGPWVCDYLRMVWGSHSVRKPDSSAIKMRGMRSSMALSCVPGKAMDITISRLQVCQMALIMGPLQLCSRSLILPAPSLLKLDFPGCSHCKSSHGPGLASFLMNVPWQGRSAAYASQQQQSFMT